MCLIECGLIEHVDSTVINLCFCKFCLLGIHRQEEEAELQRKADQEAAVAARKHKQRNQLKPEPPAGSGVSELRFKLPDGSTHNRRFYSSEEVLHCIAICWISVS